MAYYAPTHRVTQPFYEVASQDHMTNHYICTTTMVTYQWLVTYHEGLLID